MEKTKCPKCLGQQAWIEWGTRSEKVGPHRVVLAKEFKTQYGVLIFQKKYIRCNKCGMYETGERRFISAPGWGVKDPDQKP